MSDLRVPDLNRVLIAGRLTRDPELKATASGRKYCRVGLANVRYYRTRDGEKKEDTTYVDILAWGNQAEVVGERLRKGRPVLVEGSLRTTEWEDPKTKEKRTKLEINAQRVTALDWDGAQHKQEEKPRPRPIEEPIPEDDIPF